jgi:hypothetical protein
LSYGDAAPISAQTNGASTMPTDESRLPLMPVLPWQRPPVTRNAKGQFMPGVCGNPRGRPTNARLAANRAATDRHIDLKRAASYEGITPEQFVRLARLTYGKSWQAPLAAGLGISVRGVIRWAKGEYKNFARQRDAHPRRVPAARPRCPCAGPGNVPPCGRRRACQGSIGEYAPS